MMMPWIVQGTNPITKQKMCYLPILVIPSDKICTHVMGTTEDSKPPTAIISVITQGELREFDKNRLNFVAGNSVGITPCSRDNSV